MDKKNQPAFPCTPNEEWRGSAMPLEPGSTSGPTQYFNGMTKLEYFSLHAPNEIPTWFKAVTSVIFPTPPKSWRDYSKDHPLRELFKLHEDGLPSALLDQAGEHLEEAKQFDAAWKEYDKAYQIAQRKHDTIRYFQWRVFFAECLLHQVQANEKLDTNTQSTTRQQPPVEKKSADER